MDDVNVELDCCEIAVVERVAVFLSAQDSLGVVDEVDREEEGREAGID